MSTQLPHPQFQLNRDFHFQHSKAVTSVRFSPSGAKCASSSADGGIFIFDPSKGVQVGRYDGTLNAGINDLKWVDESRLIIACDDKTIKLINLEVSPPRLERVFSAHTNTVFCTAIKPKTGGNLFLSGSYDETIRVWDARTAEAQAEIEAHSDPVTSIDYDLEGTQFVSSSYGEELFDPFIHTFNAQAMYSDTVSVKTCYLSVCMSFCLCIRSPY